MPRLALWVTRSLKAGLYGIALVTAMLVLSGAYLATIEGNRKLLESAPAGARPRGEFDEVYALGADPGERENLASQGPDWARDLASRSSALLAEFFRSAHEPSAVDLPDDLRADLEALGYGE